MPSPSPARLQLCLRAWRAIGCSASPSQLYERGLVHSQRLNLSVHGDKISLCLRTLACADAGGIIYVTATEVKLVMVAIQTWCEGLAKLRL